MDNSLTLHVLNLVRRLGKNFNRKIAEIVLTLVNRKHAGSLGVVAGFAIAIIFTWKFLRPPSRPKRTQRKLIDSESTSSSAIGAVEIASSFQVDEIDDLCAPVKLTRGQITRKRLNGGRKMTCQLLGVILEENNPEDLMKHAIVRPSVVEILLEISKCCDLYFMERILDDESGDRILSTLENAGLFANGGLMKDKRFIRYQLHISPVRSIAVGSNIITSESLDCYFSEEGDA